MLSDYLIPKNRRKKIKCTYIPVIAGAFSGLGSKQLNK